MSLVDDSKNYISRTLINETTDWNKALKDAAKTLSKRDDAKSKTMTSIIKDLNRGVLPDEDTMWSLPEFTTKEVVNSLTGLSNKDFMDYYLQIVKYRPTKSVPQKRQYGRFR